MNFFSNLSNIQNQLHKKMEKISFKLSVMTGLGTKKYSESEFNSAIDEFNQIHQEQVENYKKKWEKLKEL